MEKYCVMSTSSVFKILFKEKDKSIIIKIQYTQSTKSMKSYNNL